MTLTYSQKTTYQRNTTYQERRHTGTGPPRKGGTTWPAAQVTTAVRGLRIAHCIFAHPVRHTVRSTACLYTREDTQRTGCLQDTSYKLQHVQFCASQPTASEGRPRRELHTYTCTARRNVLSVDVYTAAVYANVHGRPSLRCVDLLHSVPQEMRRDKTLVQ